MKLNSKIPSVTIASPGSGMGLLNKEEPKIPQAFYDLIKRSSEKSEVDTNSLGTQTLKGGRDLNAKRKLPFKRT